jgi:hypothetical protein
VAGVPPELAGIVAALDGTGWSCELTDARWHSVWASSEMRIVLKVSDDEDLGVGHHLRGCACMRRSSCTTPA